MRLDPNQLTKNRYSGEKLRASAGYIIGVGVFVTSADFGCFEDSGISKDRGCCSCRCRVNM